MRQRRLYSVPKGKVAHADPLCGSLASSRLLHCWTAAEATEGGLRGCRVCRPVLDLVVMPR